MPYFCAETKCLDRRTDKWVRLSTKDSVVGTIWSSMDSKKIRKRPFSPFPWIYRRFRPNGPEQMVLRSQSNAQTLRVVGCA